jgi:hypothetical protein
MFYVYLFDQENEQKFHFTFKPKFKYKCINVISCVAL